MRISGHNVTVLDLLELAALHRRSLPLYPGSSQSERMCLATDTLHSSSDTSDGPLSSFFPPTPEHTATKEKKKWLRTASCL